MKQFTKSALITMTILLSTITLNAQSQDMDKMLEPFPAAKEGMVRYVIELNQRQDESMYKVELTPGKMMNVDCNNHWLAGKLNEVNLSGWGYTYYEFETTGQVASTQMLCHEPKTDRFITSQSIMIRYNSKLPIVIYAPEGYEIRYKVWVAGDEQFPLIK